MQRSIYRRHRFHPSIIQTAVQLYYRYTLSYRDVEEILAERGIDVSYETVRRWCYKFGPVFAHRIRKRRERPGSKWRIDEVFQKIDGRQFYLWRAVDSEGEVLDVSLQPRRDTAAAVTFLRRIVSRVGVFPGVVVTDRWRPSMMAVGHVIPGASNEVGKR